MTGGEIRRGTLERVPQTPQNFPRLFYCFPETALVFVSGLFTPPHSAGDTPRRARGSLPCSGARRGRLAPRRHLLSLPRGRGPSQTPPSLATDSSISPGPPSPWLPALLMGNRFLSFLRQPWVQAQGCRGRSPRRNKLKISPFPAGEGGRGDRGRKEGEGRGRQTPLPPILL